MYKIQYGEENNVKEIEIDEKVIVVEILELYNKIIKITDKNDKVYDKRDILDKEESKLIKMLDDIDSKENMKNKIQHYLDENKHLLKSERYNLLTEELKKLYEKEDKIQMKIKFINLYFKWN